MNKTIKLLACSKNGKLYKTTTGKIYSRRKLISLIKNNKATVTTSSGAEVSIFSFEGKEFLRSNHDNKKSDNLSETLLPFNILTQHSWWLLGVLFLGLAASNIAYPLIILEHNKSHKTDLSSIITRNGIGGIIDNEEETIKSKILELNSKAIDLDWDQLVFTTITETTAHIDAKNDSKLYSGHVNVVFTILQNMDSIITNVQLGGILDDDPDIIKAQIITENPAAANIDWTQIEIIGIDVLNHTANIVAKPDSALYTGSVQVSFTILINLASIITNVDLGEIADMDEQTIKAQVITENEGADTLDWDQIQIGTIDSTSATITAKSDSTLYTGSVEVSFTIIQYNAQGTNWPGRVSGTLTCALNNTDYTCSITANDNYVADDTFTIPDVVVDDSGNEYAVTYIGDNAFQGCVGLTSVDMGQVATIGVHSFQNCAALATINLRGVTSIGNDAFWGSPLSKISLDDENSTFKWNGSDENNGYVQRKNDPAGILKPVCGTLGGIACGVISDTSLIEIYNYALEGCNITSFLCGDSFTTIGAGVFLGCMNLTTVELNKTYSIGSNAFRNCPLNSITINSENSEFDWVGSNQYNGYVRHKSDLFGGYITPVCGLHGGIACGNIAFSTDMTGIIEDAFFGCSGITSIDFVNVVTLESNWNYECVNLSSVTIGNGEYVNDGDNGWNNVGPAECTLHAPTEEAATDFKNNIIGAAYADKWTVVLPT